MNKIQMNIGIDRELVESLLSRKESNSRRDVLYEKFCTKYYLFGELAAVFQVIEANDDAYAQVVLFLNGVEINCSEPLYELELSAKLDFTSDVEGEIIEIVVQIHC